MPASIGTLRLALGAAILVLAAVLRLPGLGQSGLSSAELSAVSIARAPLANALTGLRTAHSATPLFYALLRPADEWGLREKPMRMPAALLGVVGVGTAMLLLARLFGARVALSAGVVLAAAPLAVSASRLALPLSLVAAASSAWAWSLLRLLQTGRGWWLAALLGALSLHAGYAVLAVAAAAVVFATVVAATDAGSRRPAGLTVAAVLIALAAFAPWAYYDLPTEPAAQRVLPPDPGAQLQSLPVGILFGNGVVPPLERTIAWVVGGLALLGLGVTARRRPADAVFAAGLILFTVGGVLAMAREGPQVFSPAQVLAALPLYLGFAGFALEALAGLVPLRGFQSAACALAATALLLVEVTAARSVGLESGSDWRGSLAVLLKNLGRDDRVAAPLGQAGVEFYGAEVWRRMPVDFRIVRHITWLQGVSRGWLIAPRAVMEDSHWPTLARTLRPRTVVDVSPSDDPMVLFVGSPRPAIWSLACSFELPATVVARGAFLRDCLYEAGIRPGTLRQIETLVSAEGISLRNPTLLDAVGWLARNGDVPAARKLAQAIVTREADWPEAKRELAALPPA